METALNSWWRKHGLTVALLFTAFGIAILVRTVFMAAIIQQFGPLYLYGGGSDSFYHSRVMVFLIQNHTNLVRDQLLNYPLTAVNPREPLFDWMNAIFGTIAAPLFGGDAVKAGAWFLDFDGPLFSALGVFPIYLIGKEVTSKRAGIVAAFLYPLMVANIDSSTFGYANYLSFYTFFILITLYGFLRTIKATGTRRWVESYSHPRTIPAALRQFAAVERTSVKWAVFTGVSFGTLALAWQGYSFAVAVMVIFLIFALVVERIRRVDSFGLYVNMWIIGLIGFPMAIPYYVPQGLFAGWFDQPLLIYFGALLIALPFVVLRDVPWVVSIPVLVLIGAAAVGALDLVNHAYFVSIVTGQGYFVKTLVYSTVAEAQAPSIDALIIGYGVPTFFLAFVGLALLLWRMVRQRFPRTLMMFLVFGIFSIYLPVSAAKFFFLGSAGFALLSAEAIIRVLDEAKYPELRRTVGQLSDRRGQLTAFRRALKPRHILIMLLIVGLLLPNIWYAIDAGVPYNSKSQYNQQIYQTLPPFLRTSPQNATSFYLGAAGTQLDTPTQYDEAGYTWLSQQDQNLPAPQRPAFISWWDYGFQAVSQGLHPTVADNFQNGIDPAGNFLLSQNESLAIGILATDLMVAEERASGQPYLPYQLNQILKADGVDLAALHSLLVNRSADVALVNAHPERYLAVDSSHLDETNAMYDAVSYYLATTRPLSGVAQVYNDLQTYTGWSIRYAMVDSRLFPFSGQNTGIFYAPADLTDRVIGSGGAPTAYYTLSVTASDGKQYPVGQVPPTVTAIQYNIQYTPAFYQSMIYRIFIGYSGGDVGLSQGIPGLSGSLQNDRIEPGWMMQHFQVVYKTAYYCPFANPTGHPGCSVPTNLVDAVRMAKQFNGTADTSPNAYFSGGETMLEYYPGEPMTGTVTLPSGSPVPHARVTVYDSWGIPHMTTLTDSNGAYNVLLPPGNDTVNITTGPLDARTQAATTKLISLNINVPNVLGASLNAPTLVRPVVLTPATVQGFVYWNTANNSSYLPAQDKLVPGATATIWGQGLVPRSTTTDASGAYVFANVAPGVYNFSIAYRGANLSQPQVYATPGASINQTRGLSVATVVGTVHAPSGVPTPGVTVTVSSAGSGVLATAVTNATGGYRLSDLGAGNYSVTASLPALSLQSEPSAIKVVSPGTTIKQNLSLQSVFTLHLAVVAGGAPGAGIPVRFTPILSLGQSSSARPGPNGTGAPPPVGPPTTAATVNSTVVFTDANGYLTAVLPIANYSIYGLGLQGSTLYAGFTNAYLPPSGQTLTLAPLFLSPASRLHGSVTGGTSGGVAVPTELLLYNLKGEVLTAFSNSSGAWAFEVPSGTYSLLAIQGLTTPGSPISASLANVTVSGDTSFTPTLTPGITVSMRVGYPICCTGDTIFPATSASARVSVEPSGATATAVASSGGNVSFVVPTVLPTGSSFCVSASAFGFEPYRTCGLTLNQLESTLALPLGLSGVPVQVDLPGAASGTPFTLNFTAASPTAHTTSATGTSPISVSLVPGQYRLSGWGRSPGNGLLLPPSSFNATIPFGATSYSLSLSIVPQVGATGRLILPTGLPSSVVTVQLMSSQQNLTLSGSAFQGRFLIAPGTYTVYAVAEGANLSYAAVASVSVNSTGALSSPIDLSTPSGRLVLNLTKAPNTFLSANFSLDLVGPGGLLVPANAHGGQANAILPPGTTWSVVVDTTQLIGVPGSQAYTRFTSSSGSACNVGAGTSYCTIALLGAPELSSLSGRLVYPGNPSALVGTVELVGPSPSVDVTTLAVSDGTFSVALSPGHYSIYATAGGASSPVANLTNVTVGPNPTGPITINLASTWTDYLTVTPPAGAPLGTATVRVSAGGSLVLRLDGQPMGTPIALVLPAGVYTVQASSPAAPYGVQTNASAQTSVPLLTGNAATSLRLVYDLSRSVSFVLAPPTTVVLGTGGVATFAFGITNTGNAPETIHFLGTPSTLNFTFSPSNVTLGTALSNRSAGGEVTIRVPTGTLVAHPTIQLEAMLPNGSSAGFATPVPQVVLAPTYALTVGATHGGVSVAPYSVTLGFYVANPGTVSESLRLSVSDASRLNDLGWTIKMTQGRTAVGALVSAAPGSNTTYTLSLTAAPGTALPPGSATVFASVLNGTQLTASATLLVPANALVLNSTSLVVTGPSIGPSPSLPDWVVPLLSFLPAIALAVVFVVRRYLKTRRWSRR